MTSITLSSKGQLTIPGQLRHSQSLAAGAKPLASIDAQGRLVQMPN
jgi:bifunctional DNA-binding transcriptional regulator/antitoxin component of YhaV-PrlF toxin-antitoxin module